MGDFTLPFYSFIRLSFQFFVFGALALVREREGCCSGYWTSRLLDNNNSTKRCRNSMIPFSQMFAHNSIVSAFYFKTRQRNLSNFLKIIFNFSGCLRNCLIFASTLLGPDVTTPLCIGVVVPTNVTQFMFLSSLTLFMIWRLRQIESKTYDSAICGFLFFGRIVVQVSITSPSQ